MSTQGEHKKEENPGEVQRDRGSGEEGPGEAFASLVPGVPLEMETVCMECSEKGTLRILLFKDVFFPDTVLTSFSCAHCNCRDTQTMEVGEGRGRGVEIRCTFQSAADLKRYAIVPKGAVITIESGEKAVSFEQAEDEVMVVESLIRYTLEKIISTGTLPEHKFTEEDFEGLGEYKETALFLQDSLERVDLTLSLLDKKGVARIFPVGEVPREGVKDVPLSHFADDSVRVQEVSLPAPAEEEEGEGREKSE